MNNFQELMLKKEQDKKSIRSVKLTGQTARKKLSIKQNSMPSSLKLFLFSTESFFAEQKLLENASQYTQTVCETLHQFVERLHFVKRKLCYISIE